MFNELERVDCVLKSSVLKRCSIAGKVNLKGVFRSAENIQG